MNLLRRAHFKSLLFRLAFPNPGKISHSKRPSSTVLIAAAEDGACSVRRSIPSLILQNSEGHYTRDSAQRDTCARLIPQKNNTESHDILLKLNKPILVEKINVYEVS